MGSGQNDDVATGSSQHDQSDTDVPEPPMQSHSQQEDEVDNTEMDIEVNTAKGLLGRRLIVRRLMQPRRDYLLVRGLRKYSLSDVARNKCFHTICVHNINWQNMHTSKDEKYLTRHWREIALTSTLLWQSIEFITSYDPEYHWWWCSVQN